MDYASAVSQGGNGVASASSPWASSPEIARTSFGDVERQEPLPPPAVSRESEENGRDSRESEDRGPQYGYHGPTPAGPQGWTVEQQRQYAYQQQQQQQAAQRGSSAEENRRPGNGRYHGQQQQQQPPQPRQQYKLQAKITGLERTGKKDPILRFDVYVCVLSILAS